MIRRGEEDRINIDDRWNIEFEKLANVNMG